MQKAVIKSGHKGISELVIVGSDTFSISEYP